MLVFIIHTDAEISKDYARNCLASFAEFDGWEPDLFLGYTPKTMPRFNVRKPSRAHVLRNQQNPAFPYKQACSLNHYRLFRKCIEIGEPIAVVEHDSVCIRDWDSPEWGDVLQLNARAAVENCPGLRKRFSPPADGIHDINIDSYRHDPRINGARIMAGTAAYAIKPHAAEKMVAAYETEGWEQSDFMLNTSKVRIQTVVPEYFGFGKPNLAMSWGNGQEAVG